jgi:D-alanyl-D-alanine-carboxypeptidase/D-alanyl-D-alanine-endopeptidase
MQIGSDTTAAYAAADAGFAKFALDSHSPGLVYGIVANGALVHFQGFGVQDLESRLPVGADSSFRIASMTKAFTALMVLKLRDEGRLQLDAAVENHVPEVRGWGYPTLDSPRLRVRDLLNQIGGLVTDDPWGDRQSPLPDADFTRLLQAGVPFARAPQTAMEYSNLGFALLGRVIDNVSMQPYADTISRVLLQPLGMHSTGFIADQEPLERRAMGYRFEDDAWRPEPMLGPGAFGAMGGIQTSATDYAKWLAFLLSAWPPRDDVDHGPVGRATIRELAQGAGLPSLRRRPGQAGAQVGMQATNYGMGLWAAVDGDLGFTLSHSGGYPGYGSHMLLLPDRGVGIFAFANRTYAVPAAPVWDAALALREVAAWLPRAVPLSADLAAAYRQVQDIYRRGDFDTAGDAFAMNFFLDRDRAGRARDLAALAQRAGDCETDTVLKPVSALQGEFEWRCTHGRVTGTLLLAPTRPPLIQSLELVFRHS